MHELAATRGILTTALEQMRAAGASRVTALELTIGISGHFTEDAVRQHFALLAQDTPAEGAALTFVWLSATYQCFACLHQFQSAAPPAEVVCPLCGAVTLEVEHQEVYYVSAIEVELTAADETAVMLRALATSGDAGDSA